MKLTELNPKWVNGYGGRTGVGVDFDCPGPCCLGKPSISPELWDAEEGRTKKLRIFVLFSNPLDGLGKFGDGVSWQRTGETFESLTLSPSVDASASGHWHGHLTGGEVR